MIEKLFEVILPLGLRHSLIYRIPQSLEAQSRPGCRVRVPLGNKQAIGCLLKETATKPVFKTREITAVLDESPTLSPTELKLLEWASAYYLTPIGEVLRHLISPRLFRLALATPKKRAASLSRILESVVDPVQCKDVLLTEPQREVLREVIQDLDAPSRPILLHGITGSGKTEIYRAAARKVVDTGGQALILVPEIGLTPQLVGRFGGLGSTAVVYHSALTEAQRYQVWKGTRDGEVKIVIATRSGVFLRFPNLRLIVVDEEHDSSYKQEERFCYHARDLALWRADQEKISVILGSATPSLESLYRVDQGKLKLLRLSARPSGALLPAIETIDRRRSPSPGDDHPIFSRKLIESLEGNLKRKEQSLLFLNRRGLAPFVLCPACGHVPRCDQCDISLTLHSSFNKGGHTGPPLLICHYCDRSLPYQPVCPKCHQGTMTSPGFGTQKVASEVSRMFPNARVARLDRDAMGGKEWLKILERMKKREIDILVGTQIVTKGHDYPALTLVGILDADLSLNLPDFRAAERTFQLLTQVSGRAGRADKPGRVLIQTYHPDHEGLQAAIRHDGSGFYVGELASRKDASYPPFVRLVEIRLAGPRPEMVREKATLLARRIQKGPLSIDGCGLLMGPSPCSIERVRGKSRWRLLIKTARYARLQPELRRLLDQFAENDLPSNMRMLINVDPADMM